MTVGGFEEDTTYTYVVWASNAKGNGDMIISDITTLVSLGAPFNIEIYTDTDFVFKWEHTDDSETTSDPVTNFYVDLWVTNSWVNVGTPCDCDQDPTILINK